MSIEMVVALSAVAVSLVGVFFNYYKLKGDQKTWEQEQAISLNKEVLFKVLTKRFEHYGRVFILLGNVRDIEYPKEHYIFLEANKKNLLSIADKILKELYGEAGLFMSYETRSQILKTYQNSYRYASGEIELNELIDCYYLSRRSLRKDLEFDDFKSASSSEKILNLHVDNKKDSKEKLKWAKEERIAHSPRPGYPNKVVSFDALQDTVKTWKKSGIKSIICLLSNEEIEEYYKNAIDGNLIEYYKNNNFLVLHVSIKDFSKPIISKQQLNDIFKNIDSLEEPILIHCGAGEDRTGFLLEAMDKI